MTDQRSEEKQAQSLQTAIDRVMSARRAIVDVRLDRRVEDLLLQKTSEILDALEDGRSPEGQEDGE